MKSLKLLFATLAVFAICNQSLAQKYSTSPMDKKMDHESEFIGEIDGNSYFTQGSRYKKRVLVTNPSGGFVSYEKVKQPKYNKAEVLYVTSFIYKNELYHIGYTDQKKKTTYWVVTKANKDGTVSNDPKLLFTSVDEKRLSDGVVHNKFAIRIVNNELYLLVVRNVRYRQLPSFCYALRLDENLNKEMLFEGKLGQVDEKITGVWDLDISDKFAFIHFYGRKSKSNLAIVNFKKNKIKLNEFEYLKGYSSIFLTGAHIDTESNKLILVTNQKSENGSLVLGIQQYDENWKKLNSEKIGLEDMPSRNLKYNYMSSNGRTKSKTIFGSVRLIDVDKEDGIMRMSFEVRMEVWDYESNSNNSYNLDDVRRYYNEILVVGISEETGRKRWSTIIEKQQHASWGTLNQTKYERYFIGTKVVKQGKDLVYIFNDHHENARNLKGSGERSIWGKPGESYIYAVSVGSRGKAAAKVLSKEKGLSLYFNANETPIEYKNRGIDKVSQQKFFALKKKQYMTFTLH
jgi:hypothetical protein